MISKRYLVAIAVFKNRGLGMDIQSEEDVLFESPSLDEAKKEFEFRKNQWCHKEQLSYEEANDLFHIDILGLELQEMDYDDEDDSYDNYECLDSVYSTKD